jgi:multisubunit Na+/H+ antiporter MnhF subunit
MHEFLIAALILQGALIPCAIVCFRGGAQRRLVGLGLTGTVQSLALLCLSAGFSEPGLASLAAVLAVMSIGGSLVFARLMERWL